MGKDVKNAGMLALRIRGRLLFTGYAGHGLTGEHRTGRYALDLDGLRRAAVDVPRDLQDEYGIGPVHRTVLEAMAARYGWHRAPFTGWQQVEVPPEQVGIGIELVEGVAVCLPILGGPGRHECPEQPARLDAYLAEVLPGVYTRQWRDWFAARTVAEQAELRAVVEGLRAVLG